MSTTPYPGPDEVIIPSRIYFDEGMLKYGLRPFN